MADLAGAAIGQSGLFRQRRFVRFWIARICSAGGYQMLGVAVAWQVWEITGSAVALGLVGLARRQDHRRPKIHAVPLWRHR